MNVEHLVGCHNIGVSAGDLRNHIHRLHSGQHLLGRPALASNIDPGQIDFLPETLQEWLGDCDSGESFIFRGIKSTGRSTVERVAETRKTSSELHLGSSFKLPLHPDPCGQVLIHKNPFVISG